MTDEFHTTGKNGRIVVLASGGGTNLQAILDAEKSGKITGKVVAVISDRKKAFALQRAIDHGIEPLYLGKSKDEAVSTYSRKVGDAVMQFKPDLVLLAGFMRILEKPFFEEVDVPILNIHPALLPAFGGPGMYGENVHAAVIRSGAKFSGCTVHFVTPEVDAGPIIVQRSVPVMDTDTPEDLAARVLVEEHIAYPEAVNIVISGNYEVKDNRVIVKDD